MNRFINLINNIGNLNGFSFFVIFSLFLLAFIIFQAIGLRIKTDHCYFHTMQKVLLLLFSYIFICSVDFRFGLIVLVETVVTYFGAIYCETSKNGKKIAIISITILFLFLAYFKYTQFFVNGFTELFKMDSVSLGIILPIGISFYTFSAVSYIVDVYMSKYHAEKNFVNIALFIAFFPKITAGPIIRAGVFIPQLKNYRGITLSNFEMGIQIFVIGMFKKVVLSDRLNVFVGDVFFAPTAYNTFTVALAVLSYSLQIYFDFSGYSDMAIGLSKILGFDFPRNFNLPYVSQNISEFWKRWHISLSSWFQDYLYIPLGGSRKGKKRTYINLLIVMLLSGVWHGAGYTFIFWGLFHGIISCVNKLFRSNDKVIKYDDRLNIKIKKTISIVVTFMTVSLLWVVFRADSLENALNVYKALFTLHGGIMQPYTWTFFSLGILVLCTFLAWKRSARNNELQVTGFYPLMKLNKIWTLTVFFIIIGLIFIMGYFGNTAFIYGKF